MGRFFTVGECSPDSPVKVVVLSEHFWRNYYSSDPHIVGKVIHISRQPLTVIGVAPLGSANLLSGGLWMP